MLVASVLAIVGVLLPWTTAYSTGAGSVAFNGLQIGSNANLTLGYGAADGSITLALGLVVAVLAIAALSNSAWSTLARISTIPVAGVLALIVATDAPRLQRMADDFQGSAFGYYTYAQVSVGLYVIGLAAIVGVLGAIAPAPKGPQVSQRA